MKVNEHFESIQGEGKYAGHPALFIRLSGCTRHCSFCDSKYHINSTDMSVEDLVKLITNASSDIIVWTGGEPMMQYDEIKKVMELVPTPKFYHIETNADLDVDYTIFNYVCFSPKNLISLRKVDEYKKPADFDIKVVLDGRLVDIHKEWIEQATMLMPLSVDFGGSVDLEIEQKVWNICMKEKKKFCLRQHVKVWGTKKKI